MKKITEVRASGLSRVMTCAGSLFFEGLPAQETNSAAEEGTASGELLALMVTGGAIGTHATNGVPFDKDMHFYNNELATDIQVRAKGPVSCESDVSWMTRSGIKLGAHSDISYFNEQGELCIDDLKYGWLIVDVKENWQLLAYAIGEAISRKQASPFINLRILQPRPHHEDGAIREWRITYEELLGYKEQIEARMDKIAAGFAELATSQKCKYCPGASNAVCTAFNRAVFHGVDYVLSDFQQDHITDDQVAYQLEIMGRVSEILKIKSDSIKQLAIDRIKNGGIIPGYAVEQNYGDRKWKKEVSPKVIEVLTGIKITEEKMMSPAQAEKMGVPKDLVAGFVDRHFLGMKLKQVDSAAMAAKIFNKEGK